ncbi:MAG: hypothetical protein DWQ02_20245 [Bacteroidetes bacterium]|nr:MAG: hypothetical protein DWQ02_20245 [Bacteroidota bacterium]
MFICFVVERIDNTRIKYIPTMLSMKKKLLRTKYALNQTVQKILEINRKRKNLTFFKNSKKKEEILEQDLVLLNKIAERQARLVRKYERLIATSSEGQHNPNRQQLPQ